MGKISKIGRLEKQLSDIAEDRDNLWRENERHKARIGELATELSRAEQRVRDHSLELDRARQALRQAENTLRSLGLSTHGTP